MTDYTRAEVEGMLAWATPGRRVQFHPSYCPEAEGTPFSEWDTSHDMSVIRPDGSRYKLAHYKHADDAALSQAAPDLARQLLAALDRVAELEGALAWYGEQARLARLIHKEGDTGRNALAADGGQRARAALGGSHE